MIRTGALCADGPGPGRRTAQALHTQISGEGCDGSYSRVTDFVPLLFELGETYQFGWSEEGLVVGGIYHRMRVSQFKLCASRAFWLVAYPSQGHDWRGRGRPGRP